ncbi:sodium:calcium antiporter [Ramlibacter rhizophilus]|uniref:Sodium:calcium antiporter n=2 Tax=Ramlibacter rhizophilus TaxID=1781167 RepID=A0A4Z0BUK0_9BURK|nr:sodium:calcium antiporter [Ramlibacter rhizophilus]
MYLVFGVCAVAVWLAGTRLARYANVIAVKSGLGHVTVGMVLLGGITSLPEGAVSVFSAASGAPALAVNNLLGGVAMQKALLAAVDGFIGRDALTVVSASPILLLQATLTMLLLVVAAFAIATGDFPLLGIGIGAWSLPALYLFSLWMISRAQGRQPWVPREHPALRDAEATAAAREPQADPLHAASMRSLVLRTTAGGAVILVAGFFLSQAGEAIGTRTGLGLGFAGAVLLAFATSLPELSTVVSAMRLRQHEMAISDILGTNLFNVALIVLVDAVYAGPPVLGEAGVFSLGLALLGVLLTVIFLIGLIERRNRTIGRMGVDSFFILLAYLGALFLLYQLR